MDSSTAQRRSGGRAGGGEDTLSSLPYEVLCHMASFLDSLSLSQLALVSHYMRQVCSSQLLDRGMVTLCWERKTHSHGGAEWRVKHTVSHEPELPLNECVYPVQTLQRPVSLCGFRFGSSATCFLPWTPGASKTCRPSQSI